LYISLLEKLWNSQEVLIITFGYLLILWPFGHFISYLTEPFRKQFESQGNRGLEKAGLWIGCLERFFVFSFILTGYERAIIFVVAAKSYFRYSEIKEPNKRKEVEYILIGTFLSLGLSMTTGYLIKLLL